MIHLSHVLQGCLTCTDTSSPGAVITNLDHDTLRWRHNELDGVSDHQPHGCLLNRLFRRRSKETSKLRVTGLCVGNSPGPVNSPHKGPVTRNLFPFDDVIMRWYFFLFSTASCTLGNNTSKINQAPLNTFCHTSYVTTDPKVSNCEQYVAQKVLHDVRLILLLERSQ